jgi:hypothetical protein
LTQVDIDKIQQKELSVFQTFSVKGMASNLLEVIFVTKKVQVFFVCVPWEASKVRRQANQRTHLPIKWDVAHNSFVLSLKSPKASQSENSSASKMGCGSPVAELGI